MSDEHKVTDKDLAEEAKSIVRYVRENPEEEVVEAVTHALSILRDAEEIQSEVMTEAEKAVAKAKLEAEEARAMAEHFKKQLEDRQ